MTSTNVWIGMLRLELDELLLCSDGRNDRHFAGWLASVSSLASCVSLSSRSNLINTWTMIGLYQSLHSIVSYHSVDWMKPCWAVGGLSQKPVVEMKLLEIFFCVEISRSCVWLVWHFIANVGAVFHFIEIHKPSAINFYGVLLVVSIPGFSCDQGTIVDCIL